MCTNRCVFGLHHDSNEGDPTLASDWLRVGDNHPVFVDSALETV